MMAFQEVLTMAYQATFQRWEIKYLITKQQKQRLLEAMEPYMELDRYGRTTIRNIYFDTDTYRLIRHSMEKPVYKEKLRIRSYRRASSGETVFVELKKKYRGVVYKRRLKMEQQQAIQWLCREEDRLPQEQIAREIDYFCRYYETLGPKVFLSYEREAYYCREGSDFRVTFDENILCRQDNLTLDSEIWGVPLLEENQVLLELKTPGSIPLWMVKALNRMNIHKISFSKYGKAYETMIFPNCKGDFQYA